MSGDGVENVVTRWFGPRFSELHPLLQKLHRTGGRLRGTVEIDTGRGLAGWFGARLARTLGIPIDRATRGFLVEIRHAADALDWLRRFDNGAELYSRFVPRGTIVDGDWQEGFGPFKLRLTVDIVDQSWQWRLLGARYRGIPLPLWLLPKSNGGKRIEDGRYVFQVEFVLPLVGRVLSYRGKLDLDLAS